MTKWENFEKGCCDYLNLKYGSEIIEFIHHGGSNSTQSDIEFKFKGERIFFIEAKMNLSQCGQFVLIPDLATEKFIYSDKCKSPINKHSKKILDYMNANFALFAKAGTKGRNINIDDDDHTFVNWIMTYYESKAARYFITQDNNSKYIVFPIAEFGNYFDISAKYRMKKSGSSNPPKKSYPEIKTLLSKIKCLNFQLKPEAKHLSLITNDDMSGKKLYGEAYTYMCAKEEPAEYKVSRLSNTENSNVIFSIKLKNSQNPNDLRLFLSDLEI